MSADQLVQIVTGASIVISGLAFLHFCFRGNTAARTSRKASEADSVPRGNGNHLVDQVNKIRLRSAESEKSGVEKDTVSGEKETDVNAGIAPMTEGA